MKTTTLRVIAFDVDCENDNGVKPCSLHFADQLNIAEYCGCIEISERVQEAVSCEVQTPCNAANTANAMSVDSSVLAVDESHYEGLRLSRTQSPKGPFQWMGGWSTRRRSRIVSD